MAIQDWIVVVLGILIVLILYSTLSAPVIDRMIPQMNESGLDAMNQGRVNSAYANIVNALNIMPWIFIGGLLLFGFVSSQRREPDTGVAQF